MSLSDSYAQSGISEIEDMVNQETHAWDTQNVDTLLSLFHPDMVWPWPRTNRSHDPADWVLDWGRFDHDRWRQGWTDLFQNFELIHNRRFIVKITISNEGDGAVAVVDIDTLWIHRRTGHPNHWKGRVCKVYTKLNQGWKMIMHTGVLDYSILE